VADKVICLPIYPDLEMSIVDKIVEMLKIIAETANLLYS
jgi:dTDP-4-amino-4,6-dideoxygalactose transaminase